MGRQSEYTEEAADIICEKIATSSIGLKHICDNDDRLPVYQTVFRWLADPKNATFRDKYARAREAQAELLADEIIQISDDGTNDTQINEDGMLVTNYDNIQRSRLRVDARKWKASKLYPKKYGDRMEVENTGEMKFIITTKKNQPAVDDGN